MYNLIVILILLACVLLILAVLAQNSKGGVGAAFGSSSSQLMGVKRTGDFLETATWGLLIFIFAATISTNLVVGGDDVQGPASENVRKAQEAPKVPQPAAPKAGGAAQPAQPTK